MVGSDAGLALPWLEPALQRTLVTRAHALLLHGPQGVGQFELAMTLAQAWLCERAAAGALACGHCPSCRLVQARTHPDLLVLIPQALQEALGWASEDADGNDRAPKAKPSREIKVEAVRAAVGFAQASSARGRGKVVVLHPAERMNAVSANAFLKTLEEPPGATRFVLSCAAPDALPPTIRSRCQSIALAPPEPAQAEAWLAGQGVEQPAVLLAAAGGQPQEALAWAQQGVDAALWQRLPRLIEQGAAAPLASWPPARVVDALQKVCHDAMCVAVGAAPRYFAAAAAPRAGGDLGALAAWGRELNRTARYAEHPWNAGLLVEALVRQGQEALQGTSPAGRAAPR